MPGPGPRAYTRKDPVKRAEQAAIVFALKADGHTYQAIDILTTAPDGPTGGERISRTIAHALLHEEVKRRIDPGVDHWRQIQLERYEKIFLKHSKLVDAYWDKAMELDDRAGQTVDRALKGMSETVGRESKLLGLEITKIDATVTEVTQQDIELREMMQAARAKVAAEEAELRGGAAS